MDAADQARELINSWRIWFLITALLAAGIAIYPHYEQVQTETGAKTVIATNIRQGLDLQGGARILVQPDLSNVQASREDEIMNQIVTTLKTRVETFGLQDMTIRKVKSLSSNTRFIQIELAGANTSQLKSLVSRQGRFTASMSIQVTGNQTLTFGNSDVQLTTYGDTVIIDGTRLTHINDSVTVDTGKHSIPITYANRTNTSIILHALAFTGADINGVNINPSRAGVTCSGGSCQFQFQVSITQQAAQRFKAITQNFQPGGPGGNLIGTRLVLALDGKPVDRLRVSSAFRTQTIPTPSITGGGQTRAEAQQSMNRLMSILKSGALPVPIEVVQQSNVSATLGQQFMRTAFLAIAIAVIAVSIVIFLRYQNPRIAIPIMITGFSEVIILLGVFSSTTPTAPTIALLAITTLIGMAVGIRNEDWLALALPAGTAFIIYAVFLRAPSLDLAAIAGIIAAVGTGVDDQIIITDERSVERDLSLRKQLRRAFFVIFTSAFSTIGAMLPVNYIGAGAVKGFAITTILGVIIGVVITRPAYAAVLEKLDV
ncbi:MAG: hypothetical protein SVU32_06440 [Candidatus Nanohaloarchaea archaeon]|nr:hypothetical protein [Candidatus Nanohaloarchaea archaeon]